MELIGFFGRSVIFKGCCYVNYQSNLSRNRSIGFIERFILTNVLVWVVHATFIRYASSLVAYINDVVKFGTIGQFYQAVAACL